jgi:hypothetical protein
MNKLDQALTFLSHGIAVIPLQHRSKAPAANLIGGAWEQYKTELPTSYSVGRWLVGDWHNYGVVCGWRDLVVIDFDTADAFSTWLDYFATLNKHEQIYPMPYVVKTARGGHVYIAHPGLAANEKRAGVDVKCHGYVCGPGSIHPTGAVYTAMSDFRLIDVFSLDTILPTDLFPHVAENRSCGHLGASEFKLSSTDYPPTEYQAYDPFQAAMFTGDTDLITIVKQRVRIETLFPDAVRSGGNGRWLAAVCPFHDDKHPSFWIDTTRQLCGCNVCGMKPMDVINLWARAHNMSESDAVSAMARDLGVWA